MGWEDRSYYRDGRSNTRNPLQWILNGSVPLFTVFGIRVRAHASLVVLIVLVLLFGVARGSSWQDNVQSMSVLFVIILLHEFGHCFTARWVGGEADDILMTPLGGLAMARPPRRPLPTFLTVAGGPAVNVLICLLCGITLFVLGDHVTFNPFRSSFGHGSRSLLDIYSYAFWIFQISWLLLLFNMLPIYPFDGGQMLQAILWPKFGYYKSMLFACVTGMIGAVLLGMVGLATFNLLLLFIAFSGFMTCRAMRFQVLAAGPYGFEDEIDYGASLFSPSATKTRGSSNRSIKRAQKQQRMERIEQRKIDAILAKVSHEGMHSLTWWEKRALRKATERQRKADLARGRR